MKCCTALVLGGARDVMADAAAALALFKPDIVVACNAVGTIWPQAIDFWVTLHPENMPAWQEARAAAGYPGGFKLVAHRQRDGFDWHTPHLWPEMRRLSGSSGLFAVKVAMEIAGAERLVLAGIPMEPTEHFDRSEAWEKAKSFRRAWDLVQDRLVEPVRSMSGWTRERFGAPTSEWLMGESECAAS